MTFEQKVSDVAKPDVGRDRVPPSFWDRSIKSPRLLTTFTGTIYFAAQFRTTLAATPGHQTLSFRRACYFVLPTQLLRIGSLSRVSHLLHHGTSVFKVISEDP